MLRNIGGVVAGLVAALIALLAITIIGGLVFPSSVELQGTNPAQIKAAFEGLPMSLKLLLVLAWFGGALVGALVADRIVARRWAGWAVAAIIALYVAANVAVLPMAAWMQALSVVAPFVAALVADLIGASRRRAPMGADDGAL